MAKKWISLVLFIGVFLLQPLWEEDMWQQSLDKLSTMFALIGENYYTDVDNKEMAYASIKGMLPTLDPHSYFLDPTNLATMTEDYRGKYFGIGCLIQKHGDYIKVISPIEGGPSYRLGILPNDVISHIDGESTQPITSYQAMQKLRGEKGTEVTITVLREGVDEPMEFVIVRAEIPLESIRYAFILKDDIGYIYIRNFAETTGREFREKMELLKSQGMKKLILDFRYNGGGTFLQSLEMSEDLLPEGDGIVSIRGRNQYYNKVFETDKDGRYSDVPLVIIIHEGTASAPEIVSGAVKDNDRGLLVGKDSWGKGLVQTVFRVGRDAALALTTARYYTPSGRSIQRDYSQIEDYVSYQEVPEESRDVAYTSGGRKVLGQGGISPDYEVDFAFKPLTFYLLTQGSFFNYARHFFEKDTALSKRVVKNDSLPAGFEIDDAVVQDFREFVEELNLKYEFTSEEFEESLSQMKRELEKELPASFYGLQEGERMYRLSDPLVRKALEVLPEAEKLIHRN
ncbi:MAG: S41 family peptidase [Candidatus Aminicenantaceae bacterium]